MADQIFISHRFSKKRSGYPEYSDALVLPIEEYNLLKPEEIEVIKEERVQAFCDRIDNPPVVVEPTDQEVLQAVNTQLVELENQKASLEEKVLTSEERLALIDAKLAELSEKRVEAESKVVNKPVKDTTVEFHKGGK